MSGSRPNPGWCGLQKRHREKGETGDLWKRGLEIRNLKSLPGNLEFVSENPEFDSRKWQLINAKRHDIQHSDTQHNDTHHYDIQLSIK